MEIIHAELIRPDPLAFPDDYSLRLLVLNDSDKEFASFRITLKYRSSDGAVLRHQDWTGRFWNEGGFRIDPLGARRIKRMDCDEIHSIQGAAYLSVAIVDAEPVNDRTAGELESGRRQGGGSKGGQPPIKGGQQVVCPYCGGDGRTNAGSSCQKCTGTGMYRYSGAGTPLGEMYRQQGWRPCPYCGADGRTNKGALCSKCGGTGTYIYKR